MATTAASYRNSQPTPTPKVQPEQNKFTLSTGQVCRDLEELCAAGFLEAFRDEYNIVRYRPVEQLRAVMQ
jgi:hypothetical protein